MRKIVSGMFVSLDGVVEAPEKWTGPYTNDEVGQAIGAQMASSDTMLLGRRTYETFAAAFRGQDNPMAARMNSTPKLVVSSTLKSADWENSTLVKGDVAAELLKLKQRPGKNIGVSGSATLVRWLLDKGLLDELNLIVPPVVVGHGQRLFDNVNRQFGLKLINSAAFSNGVLSLTYAPAA